MKTLLQIGSFTFAIVFMGVQNVDVQNASADQISYDLNEVGGSGTLSGMAANFMNEKVYADIGTYQFSGSVNPSQTGLIGVRSGFRAAVSRHIPGFTPEPGGGPIGGGGPEADDGDTGIGDAPGDFPTTDWSRVTIETRASASRSGFAEINGLSATNDVGYVRFDWAVTGTSSLSLESLQVSVQDAVSVAILREGGNQSTPDSFAHFAPTGPSFNDLALANLQAESFLVPVDVLQLSAGGVPLIEYDFELAVETRLDVTNVGNLGNFEALFDADFSNTATLFNVTVLDSTGAPIPDAYVTDSVTGQSIVASSVPEPSAGLILILSGCVGFLRRRRCEP